MKIFYFLYGLIASLGLLMLYYLVLRLNSSLGLLFFHNSFNYLVIYVTLTLGTVILFGVSVYLFIYQWRRYGVFRIFHHSGSGIGAIVGIVASACPVCGSTILSGIGILGGLSSLPFQGLEIKAISFGLMFISVALTVRWLQKGGCSNNSCPEELDDSLKKRDIKWLFAVLVPIIFLAVLNIKTIQSDPLFDAHFTSAEYSCSTPHL